MEEFKAVSTLLLLYLDTYQLSYTKLLLLVIKFLYYKEHTRSRNAAGGAFALF